jgi:hypothetical protein
MADQARRRPGLPHLAYAARLDHLAQDGDPIPEPSGPGVYVERAAAVA